MSYLIFYVLKVKPLLKTIIEIQEGIKLYKFYIEYRIYTFLETIIKT